MMGTRWGGWDRAARVRRSGTGGRDAAGYLHWHAATRVLVRTFPPTARSTCAAKSSFLTGTCGGFEIHKVNTRGTLVLEKVKVRKSSLVRHQVTELHARWRDYRLP